MGKMKRFIFGGLLFGTCLGNEQDDPFKRNEIQKPEFEQDDTFKVFSDPNGKAYFPEAEASFYTRYLSAMKEPSVMTPLKKGVNRVIRFTYLRSFHDPLVVRFTIKNNVTTVTAVKLQKDNHHRPVKILHNKTMVIDKETTKLVRALAIQKNFWKPLNAEEEDLLSGGLDGAQWMFEIHDQNGYRKIDIWSPDVVTASDEKLKRFGVDPAKLRDFQVYQKTGLKFLKVGGIQPKIENIY